MPTFFDIVMYLKRYVGGLVVIDDWTSVYLVFRGYAPMIRLTASLFVGLFVSLETEVHKQFIPIFPAGKIGLPSLRGCQ
jgi:hypothetical protein